MIRPIFFCLLILSQALSAQMRQPAGKIYVNTTPGGIVESYDLRVTETKTQHFLNEEFRAGHIYTRRGQHLGLVPIRYDVLNGIIQFEENGKTYTLRGEWIDYFTWSDGTSEQKYINALPILDGDAPRTGFYEVLLEDSVSLLRYHQLKVREPSYVPALDVGDRNIDYYFEEEYLLMEHQKVISWPRKKKTLSELFGQDWPSIEKFMREEKLKLKKENEYVKLVKFFNKLHQ